MAVTMLKDIGEIMIEAPKKNIDPHESYLNAFRRSIESSEDNASWVKQGLPELFSNFLKLTKESNLAGVHLDVGTYDGKKALEIAKAGLTPLVGVEILNEPIPKAKKLAEDMGLSNQVLFIRSDARLQIPLMEHSVSSVTNICVAGTHFTNEQRMQHSKELYRVMKDGAYMLSVDFSAEDKTFYGVPVLDKDRGPQFTEYDYPESLDHPHFNPDYPGMKNQHHTQQSIRHLYGPGFELVTALHHRHPNAAKDEKHAGRFLWETIWKKVPLDA